LVLVVQEEFQGLVMLEGNLGTVPCWEVFITALGAVQVQVCSQVQPTDILASMVAQEVGHRHQVLGAALLVQVLQVRATMVAMGQHSSTLVLGAVALELQGKHRLMRTRLGTVETV